MLADPSVVRVDSKRASSPIADLARHMPQTLHPIVKLKNSNCTGLVVLPAGGIFLPVAGQARSFQEAQ
jgi:hypothetical protein